MLDLQLCRRPLEFPRNLWSHLRVVLHLMASRKFRQAWQALEGVRYHPDMPEALFSLFETRLEAARSEAGAVRRINIPSDDTGNPDPRLLRPFRRLDPDAIAPRPYNRAMPLPDLTGAGNDTRFLLQTAANLAGSFTPTRRRIRVFYSPLGATRAEIDEALGSLARVRHDGRIDVSVFGTTENLASLILQGGGRVDSYPFQLLDLEGLDLVQAMTEASDLVLFLSGAARFASLALARALHVAEISDSVLMPWVKHTPDDAFSTLFRQEPAQKAFAKRYPFRFVLGLNLLIAPELLRETGLPDGRFKSLFSLPELRVCDDRSSETSDEALFLNLARNNWDRTQDGRFKVPKVSVYIPAHNASKYIESAVDSVLEQDVEDLEVCIANDGSRDGALDLLLRRYGDNPRVKILDNPNGGIGFASNSAIQMSRSPYIGQLDSDDRLKPGAVRRLMSYLDEHPDVVCAYGSCERIDAEGRYLKDEYSWPDYSRANHDQTLLYRDLRQKAEVVSGTIEAALQLINDGVVEASNLTFHLHWLNALFRNCLTADEAQVRLDNFLFQIETFLAQGGRFVWTVHNTVAHDTPFADLEIALSTRLAGFAQELYFHAAASADEVDAVFPIQRDKVVVAYPYTKSLTSGSLLLALSYSVPCVVPIVGMTAEVLDGRDGGILLDAKGSAGALELALRSRLKAKAEGRLNEIAGNAKAIARLLDWDAFAA